MDSLLFDGYTSYSDASTPRTPSPNDMSFNSSPSHLKPSLDLEAIKGIFDALHNDSIIHHSSQRPRQVPSKGSFMQELHGVSPVRLDMPHLDHHQNGRQYSSWTNVPGAAHSLQATLLSNQRFDPSTMRRNTFPYVRQDREDIFLGPKHDPSFPLRTDSLFSELLPIDGPHLSLGPDSHMGRPDQFHLFSSPTSPFRDFERLEGPGVKLEDRPPAILPSQAYMSPQQTASPSFLARYTGPHGIPIQHTDEASSKETQYLRRLCYNCRTTEPPSWRRSTLAPGKIVCNKCGLYERTHLRPRPLRFDELRAGTKSKKRRRAGSPKGLKILPPPGSMLIKKETKLTSRRLSAPSSGSTDGGSSDWDDSVSHYSPGSASQSGFNSPVAASYPIPRDPNSQSPPTEPIGILSPNGAILNDFTTLNSPSSREESPYFTATGLPVTGFPQRRPEIPEVTGWHFAMMTDPGSADESTRQNALPMVRKVRAA